MREDRFQLICKLYRLSGFCVVTSYADALKTREEKTVHFIMDPPFFYNYCTVEAVESQIKKYMKPIQNIVYIEIDSRVNYLDKVIEIGKNSNYLCIFRNEAPTDGRVQIIKSNYPHNDMAIKIEDNFGKSKS